MLNSLTLTGVGPAADLALQFTPRLNFLTGDNGLGKSFVLDIAWWALTRTWARGMPARPDLDAATPSIAYSYTKSDGKNEAYCSLFKRQDQQWTLKAARPSIPGVVIYAGVDGSFSVWDLARNYWKDKGSYGPERPRSFDFSPEQVWQGLVAADGKTQLCNGLIADWVLWQEGRKPAFEELVSVLVALSPSESERLQPGDPMRIGADVKDYPSLRMPYGQDVPLTQASAGMRRIAALAYLLVWTWREHQLACRQYGLKPAREIIFLIDEIECHLHPQWQRRIVPALLKVMQALTGSENVPVQLIAATHSPLVLASIEPEYDAERDCIWDFDLVEGRVEVKHYPFSRKGDVNGWLSSEVFNLEEPRSLAAERALHDARQVLQEVHQLSGKALPDALKQHIQGVDTALRASLSDVDRFWVRWSRFCADCLGTDA